MYDFVFLKKKRDACMVANSGLTFQWLRADKMHLVEADWAKTALYVKNLGSLLEYSSQFGSKIKS
jgi:hypothetical protein